MSARSFVALAFATLVALAQLGHAAPDARSFLDANGDRVDDALEGALGTQRLLVGYERHPTEADGLALARAGALVTRSYQHFPFLAAEAPADALARIAGLPGVRLVEKDDTVRALLRESVPLLGVPEARAEHGVSGANVAIAILDDGVYAEHPDLAGRIVASHAVAPRPTAPLGPLDRALEAPASSGHATHVAGAALGTGARSSGELQGVAPGASLVDVDVFGGAERSTSALVMAGLDWVISQRETLDIRVVCMSLGGRVTDGSDALARAADEAVASGLVVIVAAGNDGPAPGTVSSPGSAVDVITVGAVDKSKRLAEFSSRGPTPDGRAKPDLVAPGVAIVSTVPPLSGPALAGLGLPPDAEAVFYGELSGTSIAAPHVAGIVALMLEAEPTLSPADVKRILVGGAQDLGAAGPDLDTGAGFANAVSAMQVANDLALLTLPQFDTVGAARVDDGTDRLVLPLAAAAIALLVAVTGIALWTRQRRRD